MEARKYIKINKLFGKYDNEIDLSSRAIIFIGENGVGKTTIMKILQNLMNFNFNELIKYDFESIDIEVIQKNGKIRKDTIKYEELLPSNKDIKELVVNSKYFKEDFRDEWNDYKYSVPDEEKIESVTIDYLDEEWTDEEKIEFWEDEYAEQEYNNGSFSVLIEEVLEDIISKNELKNIIRKIVKNEEFTDLYYKSYIDALKDEKEWYRVNNGASYSSSTCIEKRFKNIVDLIKEKIDKIINSTKITYFDNRDNIIKLLKTVKDNVEKSVDILDMTKVYNFRNNLLSSSLITNKLLEWKAAKPSRYYDFFEDTKQKIYEEVLNQIDGRDFKNDLFDWINKDDVFDNQSKDILELNNSTIEIHSIINHYFYNEEFLIKINCLALAYYVVAHNDNWKLNNEKEATADERQIEERFIKYIRPVLLKNSPYDFADIDSIGYNQIFKDFYKKEWNLFEENVNPKMKILQELLEKYMMNKDVEVTPMGLLIKSKDDDRNIPINSLSSGEKKLLVIFMHCLFNEDVPIIIDEPEISLSIIWQENLLPDLLEKTNIKQVIVATHSSAVISDSSLDKYIIPLPNSTVDKGGFTNE